MKKYIAIATLLAAGVAFVNAENDLPSGSWTQGDGVINTYSAGWQVSEDTYGLSSPIVLGDLDTLTFSFDFYRGSSDTMLTMALVGTTQAIVLGHGMYKNDNSILIGLSSNVQAKGYAFSSSNDTGVTAVSTVKGEIVDGIPVAKAGDEALYTYTISGCIQWKSTQYVLSVASEAVPNNVIEVGLGEYVDVSKLVFAADGANGSLTKASDIKFAVSTIPEPSTFGMLAGLGALALVASRRRRK